MYGRMALSELWCRQFADGNTMPIVQTGSCHVEREYPSGFAVRLLGLLQTR